MSIQIYRTKTSVQIGQKTKHIPVKHTFSVVQRFAAFWFLNCLRKIRHFTSKSLVFTRNDFYGNESRNSKVMTCHYPDQSSASDWLKQISRAAAWPIRIVIRHQHEISAMVSQTSFLGKTCFVVAKCRLFSPASFHINPLYAAITQKCNQYA